MSLGIDIGKHSIKIVEIQKTNDTIQLKNADSLNTFNDMKLFDLEKLNNSQIIASIQDLCKKMNINPKKMKQIVSSLPSDLADVRQITTLDLPDDELTISLELEAKKHIPLDGTDTIIDYHHLGANKSELDKIDVLLVATTKSKIKEHSELIKGCGFKPGVFDADSVAIANIYQHSSNLPTEGADVILNIGNSITNLIVWGENSNFFTRNIEISGNNFTKEISRQLSLNYEEAESLKFEKGVNVFENINDDAAENTGISIEKKTIFNDFTEDIRKTLRFYMKNNNQSFFNTFYLCGGSSQLPGLKEFIASNLNVKVKILNPLNNINSELAIDDVAKYTLALGLALRGLE